MCSIRNTSYSENTTTTYDNIEHKHKLQNLENTITSHCKSNESSNKIRYSKIIKNEENEFEDVKEHAINNKPSLSNNNLMSSDTKMTSGALSTTSFSRPIENQENVSSNISTPVSSDNGYNRVNDIRFTTLGEEHSSSRNSQHYSSDSLHRNDYETGNHRNYESIATSTAFERYDPNYNIGRSSIYSYNQPLSEDVQSLQKFNLDGQQTIPSQQLIKTDTEENSGPLYPRPLYHFDPSNPNATNGFSAINLSVKIASAQAPYRSSSSPSPSVPVIDLSTSNITTSTSFHRSSRSPVSSTQSAQIPSPTGQTLDLSLSRISHR